MKRLYLAIFLVSSSVLMLEVSLTRLFSIYLYYHFAFMVISIAMLGIGSAGTLLSIYPKLKNVSNIPIYTLCAGVSIVSNYIISNYIPLDPVKLSWDRMQIFYVALYCLVLSIPFFFSGILIATAFSTHSEKSEFIYGSDLMGVGIGSLLALCILNITGPEYVVLTASTLCFVGALIIGRKNIKSLSMIFIAANLLMFILHPHFINVRISPYKSLPLSLRYPGAEHLKTYHGSLSRIDTLKSPAVRFAPGLALKYLDPLPEQIGILIDGGEMNAVTKAEDKRVLRFLEFLPSALVYEIGKKDSVLVLEPKGGLQVLMAQYYESKQIHKVESNPLIVKVIRGDLGEFSGNVFENDTWTGLGRSWLQSLRVKGQRSRVYDIIDLPMTGTSVTGAFGISEDYRFTVEAFKEYLTSLDKHGFLSISLYIISPPRTELRILTTLITALQGLGITNTKDHITAIRSWDNITIVVKKSPFNHVEINGTKEFAKQRRFDLVYYPDVKEEETNIYIRMPHNEYFSAFKNIINRETRESFIKNYLFDIAPVYDENPFFHYYLKLKNIKAIYEVMGQKWQYFIEEGYLLPVVFMQVLLLSVFLIFLPAIALTKVKAKVENLNLSLSLFFCFAMLGIGFMLIEVTLIHKSILLLENPAYAVAIVLTSILISSGIGSLFSSRFYKLRTPYLLVALSCLIVIYNIALSSLLNFISLYPLKFRIPMVSIALMPLGFFMGIPFPLGIKILGQKNETVIPWVWAINGCFSVLAPILTIMIAMSLGFKVVLWLASLVYLIAFISLRRIVKT